MNAIRYTVTDVTDAARAAIGYGFAFLWALLLPKAVLAMEISTEEPSERLLGHGFLHGYDVAFCDHVRVRRPRPRQASGSPSRHDVYAVDELGGAATP